MQKKLNDYALIVLLGLLFFLPYLGSVHLFDWDELNFAEASREMLVTGDWLTVRIDYKPFHEKPPLFFWVQAASMAAFGVNEFSARLPNAVIGIISLLVIFSIGKKLYSRKFGIIWVLCHIGSFFPNFYFRTGLIDPMFNLLIFLSILFLNEYFSKLILTEPNCQGKFIKKNSNILIAGIFCGFAVLTKGPVAWLLIILTLFLFFIVNRKKIKFPFHQIIVFSILAMLPSLIWYIAVWARNGGEIFIQFLSYQARLFSTEDAGHGGPFYYHFIVLLFGCFPASAFMFRGIPVHTGDTAEQTIFKQWLLLLLFIVLIVFSVVSTKIVHYSSLAYFSITFLSARAIYAMLESGLPRKKFPEWLVGIIGLLWAAGMALFPLALINKEMLLPKITDKFTHAIISSNVVWRGSEWLIGVLYFVAIIISLLYFSKRNLLNGILVLFGTTAISMFLFLVSIAPKIEQYTQGSAVEFYRSLIGKECYLYVLDGGNLKYGQYFYTQKPAHLSTINNKIFPGGDERQWLLEGRIDRPVYFITTVKEIGKYDKYPQLVRLYDKGGLVFLLREVQKSFKVK
ncbi:MAG: glycosyl transferase family 39 [Ignavibacteria bacterium]|nr:glycosyl transferase family 39 [Ignavibacteria bacterium]